NLTAHGVSLSLSRVLGRGLADELLALTQGPSPRFPVPVAAQLMESGLLVRPVCDEIADTARDGARVTRVGFAIASPTAARPATAGVLVVRLSASSDGVLPELGVEYRVVAAENVLKIWQAVRQNTQISRRMGAFVGATGVEVASAFEIRWTSAEPPACDAFFEL